jgi:hypothetical protein
MIKFIFAIVLAFVFYWLMGVVFTIACMRVQFMNTWVYSSIAGLYVVTWLQCLTFCGTLFWMGSRK